MRRVVLRGARATCAVTALLLAGAAQAQPAPQSPASPPSLTTPTPATAPADAEPAAPDPSADALPAAEREARELFQRALELYRRGRCAEALPLLERSHALLGSPNSALLVGRCLQIAGRRVEAAEAFAGVERLAAARAAAGDKRYAEAASAAAAEGAALRRRLGVLRVRVAGAAPGTSLEIDGTMRALSAEGAATVLREPGPVSLVLRAPGRPPLVRSATLVAGGEASIDFLLDAPAPTGAAAPAATATATAGRDTPTGGGSSWMLPAAVAAGTVGAIGVGAFIGFGIRSRDTYDALHDRCGPSCGDSDAAEADAGRRDQAIANVSLAFGAVGVVGAVVLGVLEASRPAAGRPLAGRRAVIVGPGPSLGVAGSF